MRFLWEHSTKEWAQSGGRTADDRIGPILKTAAELERKLREVSDPDPESDAFAVAESVYWFAAAWHGGQGSRLYWLLDILGESPIRFRPGAASHGPEAGGGGERLYRFFRARAARSLDRAKTTAEHALTLLQAWAWDDPEADSEDDPLAMYPDAKGTEYVARWSVSGGIVAGKVFPSWEAAAAFTNTHNAGLPAREDAR